MCEMFILNLHASVKFECSIEGNCLHIEFKYSISIPHMSILYPTQTSQRFFSLHRSLFQRIKRVWFAGKCD